MARFSSAVVPRILVTCSSHDLPKMQTTGVSASIRARMFTSSDVRAPALRVLPKAVNLACLSPSWRARRKNSMSLGFEPG